MSTNPILLAGLLLLALEGMAQPPSFNFTEINTDGHLPSLEVSAMYMDRTGYMWIGTFEGLARFDGHNFKVFLHDPDDSTSISNNNIHDIIEDENGYLWVTARGGGLNRFDPVTETFKRYSHDPDDPNSISGNECNRLFIDSDQNLWITTFSAGFNKYLPETESFLRIPIDTTFTTDRASEVQNSAYEIIEDVADPNTLWISGHYHFLEYHKDSRQLIFHRNPNGRYRLFSPVMAGPEEIWLGTWGLGLLKFNPRQSSWETYFPELKKENIFNKQVIIRQLLKKSTTELWLADGNIGLMVFDRTSEQFYSVPEFEENKGKEGYWIRSTYDRNGRLWAAGRSGIRVLDPQQQKFNFQPFWPGYNGLAPASGFAKSQNGHLFVATRYGDGVYHYDEKGHYLETLPVAVAPHPNTNGYAIADILVDSKDNLWAIDNHLKVILRYDRLSQRLEPVLAAKLKELPYPDFVPQTLIESEPGILWLGTNYGGIIKIDLEGNTLRQFVSPSEDYPNMSTRHNLQFMAIDNEREYLWISIPPSGVIVFSIKEERFTRHYPQHPQEGAVLPEGVLKGIAFSREGHVWLANHGAGVQVVDPKLPIGKPIEHYSLNNGLPSNNVTYIERDAKGDMWIYTYEGLARYDRISKTFQTFTAEDGLRDPRVGWQYGFEAFSDSTFYIGQRGGFHHFHIDSLPVNNTPPTIVFSWFKVLEEERTFDKSLNHLSKITLPYADNYFSIGFAALNFTQPEDNQYAYQLEGFDEQLVQAGNRNFATYTNVPERHYTFRVIAANNDGVWNEEGISLDIVVLPPWYRTVWAYLAYVLLLAAGVYAIYRFQKNRWQLQTKLQLEQEEASRLKELDEVKSRLYTNITHEFRTPLTVIKGMAGQIRGNSQIRGLIRRNADNLLRLINQMLDLAKIESGNMALNLKQEDIILYLKYITQSFQSLAEEKQIGLAFHSSVDELVMDFDREKLRQLVANLLSNAIKFTPEGGTVSLEVEYGAPAATQHSTPLSFHPSILIQIRDSGIGIPPKELPLIFDRFRQVDASSTRQGEGTGIGLALVKELVKLMSGRIEVESKVGKGTVFKVRLPITNNAKSDEAPALPLQEVGGQLAPAIESISHRPTMHKHTNTQKHESAKTLLIIEDNPDIISYLRTLLRGHYRLSIAQDGAAGIEKAIAEVPDIILCDVMMPKKDGFEVCNSLKNDRRTSHIPIVMLTAKGDQKSKEEGLRRGADAYLPKPFEQEELFIRIEQLLRLRETLREKYRQLAPGEAAESAPADDPEMQFLKQLEQIVQENIGNDAFRVEPGLCRSMAMSRPQLYRKLRALRGVSPSEYIRQLRLQKGKQLLRTTGRTVSDIAAAVGFNDASYFARIFSEAFGKLPSDMRR